MLLQEERFVALFFEARCHKHVQCGGRAPLHLGGSQRKKVGTEGYFRKETEGFIWDRRFQSLIFYFFFFFASPQKRDLILERSCGCSAVVPGSVLRSTAAMRIITLLWLSVSLLVRLSALLCAGICSWTKHWSYLPSSRLPCTGNSCVRKGWTQDLTGFKFKWYLNSAWGLFPNQLLVLNFQVKAFCEYISCIT